MAACLVFILADVLFSLLKFHTRKTIFIIGAVILSIPFARNLASFIVSFKARSLSRQDYEKVLAMKKSMPGVHFLFDVGITESDGVMPFPVIAVYNNNVIPLLPEAGKLKRKVRKKNGKTKKKNKPGVPEESDSSRAKRYLSGLQEKKVRVFPVTDPERMEKELLRVTQPSDTQRFQDRRIAEELLELSF